MTVPVVNGDAVLAGCLPAISVSPWVADYGAASFVELGAAKDVKMTEEIDEMEIDAENCMHELGAIDTKFANMVKFTLLQYDPSKRLYFFGKPSTDLTVVAESGPTPGTLTYGFGTITRRGYWTVKLTVNDLDMFFGISGAPDDRYVIYERTFAKCRFRVKSEIEVGKNKIGAQAIEMKAYHDATVTDTGLEVWKEVWTTAGGA